MLVARPKTAWRILFPAFSGFLVVNGVIHDDVEFLWAAAGPLIPAIGSWTYRITLTGDTLCIRRPPRRTGRIAIGDIRRLSFRRQDLVKRLPVVFSVEDSTGKDIAFETWFWSGWRKVVAVVAARVDTSRIEIDEKSRERLQGLR